MSTLPPRQDVARLYISQVSVTINTSALSCSPCGTGLLPHSQAPKQESRVGERVAEDWRLPPRCCISLP